LKTPFAPQDSSFTPAAQLGFEKHLSQSVIVFHTQK